MGDCPNCGGDPGRGRYVPGGCICKREPERNDGDTVDEVLEASSRWNYFTPAAELTGIPPVYLVVLAILLIVGVFVSHGTLWG